MHLRFAKQNVKLRPFLRRVKERYSGRSVVWYLLCARAGDCYSMMRVRLVVAEKVAGSLIKTEHAGGNTEPRRRVH